MLTPIDSNDKSKKIYKLSSVGEKVTDEIQEVKIY